MSMRLRSRTSGESGAEVKSGATEEPSAKGHGAPNTLAGRRAQHQFSWKRSLTCWPTAKKNQTCKFGISKKNLLRRI